MALKSFLNSVLNTIRRDVTQIQIEDAQWYFDEFKREIIWEIINHPISRELSNHTYPSSFLSGIRGTLFGFMGFTKGKDVIGELVSFVENNINYTVTKRILKGVKLNISIPDYKDMRNEPNLILPWDGGIAWPQSIEQGISGLGYYLYTTSPKSRSSEGLQFRNELRAANYIPRKYLSVIFKNAEKKIARYR